MSNLKSTDIILVLSPHRWKEHRYSLGLLYVSAYLKEHGYDNLIIGRGNFKDEYKEKNRELAEKLIIKKIKELKPKMVGFSSTIQEFDEIVRINKELKKDLNFISIIGGPQSTAKPEEFLDHGFDISVVGEGEQTALEIAEHVNNQDMDWSKINGIVYRNSNNEIIQNPPREYLDISNLPLPAYNKVDMKGYVGMWDGIIRGLPLRGALIMSSRGCPYACTFCDCNKVFGQHVRYRSLENIEQEVQLLKQTYGVEGIWSADDTFTLNKEHILGVGKIMKKHKMIWGCQARVNLVDEKLIKTMKKLGCIQFDLGVESGSQRVLDEVMNKKTNLDQVRQAFRLCHKYKIRTLANLMMGLPTESKEEMEQTMDLAREIKANFYVFSIFTPLPGTTLFDKYYKNEIDYRDYKELNFFAGIERFNKSKVKDLKTLNTEWRKELAMRMKKSNLTLHYVFLYLKIFFKLKHKKKRLQFVLKKVLNLIRK